MVRKQVYIAARQERFLKRRARELRVTEATLIREGIDRLIRSQPTLSPDAEAWNDARDLISQRAAMRVPQIGRTWSRDDLYEDRIASQSH